MVSSQRPLSTCWRECLRAELRALSQDASLYGDAPLGAAAGTTINQLAAPSGNIPHGKIPRTKNDVHTRLPGDQKYSPAIAAVLGPAPKRGRMAA